MMHPDVGESSVFADSMQCGLSVFAFYQMQALADTRRQSGRRRVGGRCREPRDSDIGRDLASSHTHHSAVATPSAL